MAPQVAVTAVAQDLQAAIVVEVATGLQAVAIAAVQDLLGAATVAVQDLPGAVQGAVQAATEGNILIHNYLEFINHSG